MFTGDEYADGGEVIKKVLRTYGVKASFFLTGHFYANPAYQSLIRALKREGHYLGAHSDKHLLYADWTSRDSLLVTQAEFSRDLNDNYQRMARFGIKKGEATYFLPPYEWYNATIAQWTKNLDLCLVNFSPGTRSAADYTYPEMGERYVSSKVIYQSIMEYESKNPNGLNGFILLMHIGTNPGRTDKMYNRLDSLLSDLQQKGYRFVRIDQLLE